MVRPKAAGLVNAILRRVTDMRGTLLTEAPLDATARDLIIRSDGSAWQLTAPALARDALKRLSQQSSIVAAAPEPLARCVRRGGSDTTGAPKSQRSPDHHHWQGRRGNA